LFVVSILSSGVFVCCLCSCLSRFNMWELDDQDGLYDVLRRMGFYFIIWISFRYLELNGFCYWEFLWILCIIISIFWDLVPSCVECLIFLLDHSFVWAGEILLSLPYPKIWHYGHCDIVEISCWLIIFWK